MNPECNCAEIVSTGITESVDQQSHDASRADKYLTRLIEMAAVNVPDIDAKAYKAFRAKMSRMAPQLPNLAMEEADLELFRKIIHEFGQYHKSAEIAIQLQISGWRELVTKLLSELLCTVGVDLESGDAAPMMQSVATLLTGEEIRGYSVLLSEFLRVKLIEASKGEAIARKTLPAAVTNDNAAGLRGDSDAVEQIKNMLNAGSEGYVVAFHLNCLDSIKARHGVSAVHDSIMAVSAFLTRQLRSDDTIYYWNESSLVAILETPAPKRIISAAIQRILDNNRDITVHLGVRVVMLRVPMIFEITPISQLRSAEDLYELPSLRRGNLGAHKPAF
jgi:GGDEF domain-containing protein